MKRIFYFVFLIQSIFVFSQTKKIVIENSEIQFVNEEKYPGATILLGDVQISHDGIRLKCKKAFFFKEKNFFKAIGNVLIKQGDTITQTSDYADYDANTKQALSFGNVVLKDPTMTLTTDTLHFDRLNQKLYYTSFATIKDQTNTLKSKNGKYYLESNKFTATTKVTVVNPEHNLESNHLDYYTDSGLTYLYGPSTITNTENKNRIYCEKGFYNTKTDVSHFVKNAKLYLKERTIEGDSLYYDKNNGFASATNNIQVIDTVQNFVTRGNYAEIFELKDSLFVVKRAVAISIIDKDSMFVHGDTLLVTGKPEKRIVRTYNNVKIFKSDLQGKCDSIHTNQENGLTRMFRKPVLWSDGNQITGDTIHLLSNVKTEKLDSLKVLNNAFIVSQDTVSLEDFNQIKGRNMFGKFENNKIRLLLVKGNAESVYFNRNEDTQELETITKEISSNIEFTMLNGQIETIKYLKKSDGKSYPPSLLPDEVKRLKGFIWREDEQPKTKEDIFKKGNSKDTPGEDTLENKKNVAILDKKKLSQKKL
ncbi:OstA-like protein [uncultured Polaribacter sp.]|uniref:OstA-like protein n=1 Tax=uncultured Polaribacter sp. TaxID=174711 RepID=UPI0026175580|nr:OstA-like protein [uncultured Polaribacter sp.]